MKRHATLAAILCLFAACALAATTYTVTVTTQSNLGDSWVRSWTFSSAGEHEQQGVRTVTQASESSTAINANITGGNDPGLVVFENLGTNWVTVGTATGVRPIRVDASNTVVFLIQTNATSLFHQADTIDTKCRYKIVER